MNRGHTILKIFKKFLNRLLNRLWYCRKDIPLLNFPIPWYLPYGGWFLIYPDEMGAGLFFSFLRSNSYEKGEWLFLSRFIRPGMICFDIGANQGFYTILLSKKVGNQGKVFAFEPVPSEFKKLIWNKKINRCGNIVLENMAVAHYEGFADMFICLDGHGSRSSMAPPPEEVKARTKIERVPVISLDLYVRKNNIKENHFVKIDVEGSEKDVLKGAGEYILKELRPLIMIELADIATQQFGYQAVEIYRYLESCGFDLFEFTCQGLLKPAIPKTNYRENLLAVPKEKLDQVSNFMEKL